MHTHSDDWIERSFQLAFFILHDRSAAVETVKKALDRFSLQRRKERKRAFWRNRHLKYWITRVSKTDLDILQWLIYCEAGHLEKQQERFGRLDTEVMVTRYIKCLVQITTVMSTFHLNIGLQRLLRTYRTPETQKIYEIVTDHHVGADEYRRAKAVLMTKLQTRFGSLLKTCLCKQGEVRFEAMPDQHPWTALVDECLSAFIPWSTRGNCLVPPEFDSVRQILPQLLSGASAGKGDHDIIETNRFHAFLDPACFSRLVRAVGLDPPQERLSVPKFFFKSDETGKPGAPGRPVAPPLDEQERASVRQYLAEQVGRRHKASSQILRITVDGVERSRVRADQAGEQQFEIDEGAELIEVWVQDEAGDLLLADHRVGYDACRGFVSFENSFLTHQGRKLRLRISPWANGDSELRRATVTIGNPKEIFVLSSFFPRPTRWLWVAKYTLPAVCLVAIGWLLAAGQYHRQQDLQRAALARLQSEVMSERALRLSSQTRANVPAPAVFAAYKLISDNRATRDLGLQGIPNVAVPTIKPSIIILELPIGRRRHRQYRAILRPFDVKREILSEILSPKSDVTVPQKLQLLVPTALLESGRKYTVDLRFVSAAGQWREIDSFTFQTVKDEGVHP